MPFGKVVAKSRIPIPSYLYQNGLLIVHSSDALGLLQ